MYSILLKIFVTAGFQIIELPLCFPDPGWSGKEESHLSGSGAAFYERHNGSSLPCSRKDHHCQKLPTWLWDRGKMMLVSLWKIAEGLHAILGGKVCMRLSVLQVIELCRPSDSRLEHVDFECLFSSLSLRLLLRVFASLLLERRVIFTADKLRLAPETCCHRPKLLINSWNKL